jgi:hypothetical protein
MNETNLVFPFELLRNMSKLDALVQYQSSTIAAACIPIKLCANHRLLFTSKSEIYIMYLF